LKESQEGPPRKYYRITDYGRVTKESMEQEWRKMVNGMNKILEGKV
jgi:PadR family transcriptional regulator PadR